MALLVYPFIFLTLSGQWLIVVGLVGVSSLFFQTTRQTPAVLKNPLWLSVLVSGLYALGNFLYFLPDSLQMQENYRPLNTGIAPDFIIFSPVTDHVMFGLGLWLEAGLLFGITYFLLGILKKRLRY